MAGHDFTKFAKPAPHPGEFLREDYLPQYGLTAGALARAMGLRDRSRVEQIIREKIGISADTALRLARVFGTTPQYWMGLQKDYDLSKAAIANRAAYKAIKKLEPAAD
ncbi:MAG: HigA family addiction module antidote protein [Alphaproteobacteria bacterium]|nr:HigA family addiction module antidote protein [Alphaproteobacteria bacterium]